MTSYPLTSYVNSRLHKREWNFVSDSLYLKESFLELYYFGQYNDGGWVTLNQIWFEMYTRVELLVDGR